MYTLSRNKTIFHKLKTFTEQCNSNIRTSKRHLDWIIRAQNEGWPCVYQYEIRSKTAQKWRALSFWTSCVGPSVVKIIASLMCKRAVSQRVMSIEHNNNTAKTSCQSLVKYTQDKRNTSCRTERIFQSFVLEKASFCLLYIVVLELAAVLQVLVAAYCPDSSRPSDTIKKQRKKHKLSQADSREHVTPVSHIRFKTTSRAQLRAPKTLPEDQCGSVQSQCSH